MPSPKELVRQRQRAKQVRRQQLVRGRNVRTRSALRTFIRHAEVAIESGDSEAAGTAVRFAQSRLDAAGRKGVIHRRQAARRISRLIRLLRAVDSR